MTGKISNDESARLRYSEVPFRGTLGRLPGLILVCFGWFGCVVSCSQMRGVWNTHLSGRTHFHGTQAPPPKSESSASKILRHSGMTVAFKATFEVFTRVSPDNSLERLTERSVGLVTDRPGNVYELFVTLFE
jgi:hypothetical protein